MAETPAAIQQDEPVTERLKTVRWVSARFIDLGYDELHADLLAHNQADHHTAAKLINAGWSLTKTERFLLP